MTPFTSRLLCRSLMECGRKATFTRFVCLAPHVCSTSRKATGCRRSKTTSASPTASILSSFHEPSFLETATVDPDSRRVWKANASDSRRHDDESSQQQDKLPPLFWTQPVHETAGDVAQLLERIGKQELDGGRMQQRRLGVLREDPAEDMRLLTENYTVPALASAIRDREETLQLCAELLQAGNLSTLQHVLHPYQQEYVLQRRTNPSSKLNLASGLTLQGLEQLRKALMRMPRRVSTAHRKRAEVVVGV